MRCARLSCPCQAWTHFIRAIWTKREWTPFLSVHEDARDFETCSTPRPPHDGDLRVTVQKDLRRGRCRTFLCFRQLLQKELRELSFGFQEQTWCRSAGGMWGWSPTSSSRFLPITTRFFWHGNAKDWRVTCGCSVGPVSCSQTSHIRRAWMDFMIMVRKRRETNDSLGFLTGWRPATCEARMLPYLFRSDNTRHSWDMEQICTRDSALWLRHFWRSARPSLGDPVVPSSFTLRQAAFVRWERVPADRSLLQHLARKRTLQSAIQRMLAVHRRVHADDHITLHKTGIRNVIFAASWITEATCVKMPKERRTETHTQCCLGGHSRHCWPQLCCMVVCRTWTMFISDAPPPWNLKKHNDMHTKQPPPRRTSGTRRYLWHRMERTPTQGVTQRRRVKLPDFHSMRKESRHHRMERRSHHCSVRGWDGWNTFLASWEELCRSEWTC